VLRAIERHIQIAHEVRRTLAAAWAARTE